MNKLALSALLMCSWFVTPLHAQDTDDEATASAGGAEKAAVCAACHGGDGKALQPNYPNLAGQHPSYLAKQLADYRDGERVNALMSGQAAALTDEDITALADHYGDMPKIEGAASEENLELGESIYRGGITSAGVPSCIGCHGPAGLGNPAAVYPLLSGQMAAYTADQLRYFRSGERANDPNAMMRSISHRLTDTEIEAVSNYIAGLHPVAEGAGAN